MVMDQAAMKLVRQLVAVATKVSVPVAVARTLAGPDKTIRVPGGWVRPEVAVDAGDAIEAAEAALAEVEAQIPAAMQEDDAQRRDAIA